jgi:hypothetical protein
MCKGPGRLGWWRELVQAVKVSGTEAQGDAIAEGDRPGRLVPVDLHLLLFAVARHRAATAIEVGD